MRGKAPESLLIRLTRHGPVVKEFTTNGEKRALAARWAVLETDFPLRAVSLMARSESIHDVIRALKHWEAPGQNFVFADTRGNIGYWCCAVIPVRPQGNGLLPLPGWNEEYDWKGTVPFEEKPHLINPAEGFIATANSRVTGPEYPYSISTYWDARDRTLRIRQMLAAQPNISVEDVHRMQMDVYSSLAEELVPRILRAAGRGGEDKRTKQAADLLSAWDYRMEEGSAAASVFEATTRHLLQNLFEEELGRSLYERYLELVVFPPRALRLLIREDSAAWLQTGGSPEAETLDDVVAKSLQQALVELGQTLGDNPNRWQWGELHTLTFEHVLGKRQPLDRIFNLGPFPVSGNNLTVDKKQYSYTAPYAVKEGASQRMIVDLFRPETALHVLPTGQSGLKGNLHHQDQVSLYLDGGYRTFRMNRADLESRMEGTLTLVPGK